jgi:hypothetical protein
VPPEQNCGLPLLRSHFFALFLLLEAVVTERAMRNGVALRAAGPIMAHPCAQAQAVPKPTLGLRCPQAGSTLMPALGVCQDQEVCDLRLRHAPKVPPPLRTCCDSQRSYVHRRSHICHAVVALQVIDVIRHFAAKRMIVDIMDVGLDGMLTPYLPGVLEVPHQFFLLSVHADDRTPRQGEHLSLHFKASKFGAAIRLMPPCLYGIFFPARGRPALGRRTQPIGCPASSRRARWMVCSTCPMICATRRTTKPNTPVQLSSMAAYHRRCCAFKRDWSKFIS